jgi:hypothetical protein
LTYDGRALRRFCSNTTHSNPNDCPEAILIQGYHKHRWRDETGDECAYVPEDISLSSMEEAFYDFCAECGVTFNGVWSDPPEVQMGFETV